MAKTNRNIPSVLRALILVTPDTFQLHKDLLLIQKEYDSAFLILPKQEFEYWEKLGRLVRLHFKHPQEVALMPWAIAFLSIYNEKNHSVMSSSMLRISHEAFVADKTRERFVRLVDFETGEFDQNGMYPPQGCRVIVRTLGGEMRTGWVQALSYNKLGEDCGSYTLVVTSDDKERKAFFMRDLMCWRHVDQNQNYASQLDKVTPKAFI